MKTINIISYIVLIVVVLLYAFKPVIMPFYFNIQFKSPVQFHNVKISFPKGIVFNRDKNIIGFHYWDNLNATLYAAKMNSSKMKKESLINFFKKKNFNILETSEIDLKGIRCFTIAYIDSSWKYNKAIYIPPKSLRITYQGTKDNYQEFLNIVDNMEFL